MGSKRKKYSKKMQKRQEQAASATDEATPAAAEAATDAPAPPPKPAPMAPPEPTGWRSVLQTPRTPIRGWQVAALIVVAYAFAVLIRLAWLDGAYDANGEIKAGMAWNDAITLTATDGYYFANAVKQKVEGLEPVRRSLEWDTSAVSLVAVAAAKILPASVEEVTFYMPAYASALLVIPVLLIGWLLGRPLWGFSAALIAGIGWSYYNRTMLGYFDSDIFIITVPLAITACVMACVERQRAGPVLGAVALMAIAPLVHQVMGMVMVASAIGFVAYLLLFHRDDVWARRIMPVLVIAALPLPWWVVVPLAVLAYVAFGRFDIPKKWLLAGVGVGVLGALIFTPTLAQILGSIEGYGTRSTMGSVAGLDFLGVSGTIREAQILPFERIAQRMAGHGPGLVCAIIGYLLLVLRHRSALLLLPFAAIGFYSVFGGLRFTVFAVPLAALGATYLAFLVAGLGGRVMHDVPAWLRRSLMGVVAAGLSFLFLLPHIDHALSRPSRTVIHSSEIQLLDDLRKQAKRGDYVIAWWDYGYPIMYYSGLNTLIDGAKHRWDNFIVAEILTGSTQARAANLARLAVEHYHKSKHPKRPIAKGLLRRAEKKFGLNAHDYLAAMDRDDFKGPKATRDIYLYLPYRMIRLVGTIERFARDAHRERGSRSAMSVFVPRVQRLGTCGNAKGKNAKGPCRINLGQRGTLFLQDGPTDEGPKKGDLQLWANSPRGRRLVTHKARSLVLAKTKPNGESAVSEQSLVKGGALTAYYMADSQAMYIVDQALADSVFVQLFILGKPDPKYFELTSQGAYGKIFKIKR